MASQNPKGMAVESLAHALYYLASQYHGYALPAGGWDGEPLHTQEHYYSVARTVLASKAVKLGPFPAGVVGRITPSQPWGVTR